MQAPFDHGPEQMKVLAGLEVTPKAVEAKLGCVFTQTTWAEKLRTAPDYFQRNAERVRYPEFRRQHWFVGSGVIEAGCKTAIGSRLKRSGMF